jgi:hypothetical protein
MDLEVPHGVVVGPFSYVLAVRVRPNLFPVRGKELPRNGPRTFITNSPKGRHVFGGPTVREILQLGRL